MNGFRPLPPALRNLRRIAFCFCAILTALVVIQSHRVFGPLYRFKVVFEAVTRGDLWVSASLRTGDYPIEEARSLGEMLSSLRRHIGDAQGRLIDAVAIRGGFGR